MTGICGPASPVYHPALVGRGKARCHMEKSHRYVSSPPPLRTVLKAFTLHGSAPSVGLCVSICVTITLSSQSVPSHVLNIHRGFFAVDSLRVRCVPLVRSSRRLGAFAIGVFFDSASPACGRLSRPPTPMPLPPLPQVIGFSRNVCPPSTSHRPSHA